MKIKGKSYLFQIDKVNNLKSYKVSGEIFKDNKSILIHYWECLPSLKAAKETVLNLIEHSIDGNLPINKDWKVVPKTSNFSDEEKHILVEHLLTASVKSSGYPKEELKEVRLQRRKAKAKLQKVYKSKGISALDFSCHHGRLCFFNGKPAYFVAKNFNEEITLAIERMVKYNE